MKHWTLCLGVMNIFRGGGERLAVFQPWNIQPFFSHSLSVQQSCVLYLKPVEHPYWFYIHIFSQIFQNRENLKCPLMLFFPLHTLPPLVTLHFLHCCVEMIGSGSLESQWPDPAAFQTYSLGYNQRKSCWPELLEKGSLTFAHQEACIWGEDKMQMYSWQCC